MRAGGLNVPNHGYSNRPGSVTDTESKIGVVCLLVFSLLHEVYDLCEFS